MIEVPAEFLAFLEGEAARCEDTSVDERREAAIDSYNGELYGNEEEGRSQAVTRDVAEVVDYMTVSLLRTVVSGDKVVEFEPRSKAQAQFSDDATEVVTQQFMRRQNGYRILHDACKAGLLEITGVIKTYPEPQPAKRVEMEIPAEALALVDAVEAEPVDETEAMWRVVVMEPQPPKFCDVAVPNEEFKCAADARDLDSARYMAHVPPTTMGDLVEMGFPAEDIESLPMGVMPSSGLAQSRDMDLDVDIDRMGANARVDYREEHVLYDLNGDGVAERLVVHRVGTHVLAIDEEEDHPFEEWCPFPMPHRRIGQSLAEKVLDIQLIRSILLRQSLDNLYLTNAPRVLLHDTAAGDNTIEDLLTVRPNGVVRWAGAIEPKPITTPFMARYSFEAMELLAGEKESRTGITRLNQGLDADTLNKTATGTALMQAQGQQIEEYLARNFAEFLARLFAKKLRMMKRYGQPIEIRVDGEFREVDPRQWDESMDLAIRVGLGSGKKEQRLVYRQQILEAQALALQNGMEGVNEDHIYNSIAGMVKDMGLGAPSDFWSPPQKDAEGNPVPKQPKPDPEMAKVQADAEMKQAELAGKQEMQAADLLFKEREGELKLEMEREKAQAQIELERERAANEAQLAREKAAAEIRLAEEKFRAELQMNERRMEMEERLAERNAARADYEAQEAVKIKKNRPGGDLSK